MKIKIFQSIFEKTVERKTNDFLAEKDVKVLEIQYGASAFYFSVMIVYEDVGEK